MNEKQTPPSGAGTGKPQGAEKKNVAKDVRSGSVRKRRKLLKKAGTPSSADAVRYHPTLDRGLTSTQVDERFRSLLFNDVHKKYSKSYRSIFFGNLFTFFNLLCLLAAVALIFAGAPITQFLFVAIFLGNITIGIVQEILAKRQIDKLAVLVSSTVTVVRDGKKQTIGIRDIVLDDIIYLTAGQQIPADCAMVYGTAEVNESLLTGESVPIKKAPGDILYAGSFVASGACYVRADKVGAETYLNQLTSKAKKYKKPNSEIMNSIRRFIYIIGFAIVVVTMFMFPMNFHALGGSFEAVDRDILNQAIQKTCSVVIGMIPSGMLLLTSVAMAVGMRRLGKKNTLVQDMYSLEMLARVNVLCLDKTGTITDGRMTVNDCMLLNNYVDYSLDEIMGSMLASLDDNNQTSIALCARFGYSNALHATAKLPFSSKRKLSAVTFGEVGTFVMGAPEFVLRPMPPRIGRIVKQYAQMGLRVLVVAYAPGSINGDKLPSVVRPMAIVTLADNVRPDAAETIKWFADNDVEIKIISGDNPVTVSEVARRVGLKNANKYVSLDGLTDLEVENLASQYTVFGRVTPEQKAILVRTLKSRGKTVGMTGDGVNDILAMKEADCAISVASGSEAARNVAHLVLTDNNFLNLPNVVFEGRRVINNIKSCASLYIMKTLFTLILSCICLIISVPYFFTTNNMLLFEVVVAAIPSVCISLQPNSDPVRGKFFLYVLSRSIPSAICLILCVMAVYVGHSIRPEDLPDSVAMMTVAISFGGVAMLYRILKPFNPLRITVFVFSLAASILVISVPALAEIIYTGWSSVHFSFTEVLYVLCILLLSFPISDCLTRWADLINPT